jgi:hypothetical protein
MSHLSLAIETEYPSQQLTITKSSARIAACVVVERNLSVAWLRAFTALAAPGVKALAPLVISVTGFHDSQPEEVLGIRSLLDQALAEYTDQKLAADGGPTKQRSPLTCRGVANTIFPGSLWSSGADRQLLYKRYSAMLPRLKRRGSPRGLYFERLIAYGRGPQNGNQLEHIIEAYRNGLRRTSAFQATICDPQRDSTRQPRLGFPCLQQIALHPDGDSLSITGFYGTQYVFERAYGNFLGLCWLGNFLAYEMGLTLKQMTCIAAYAPFSGGTRGEARHLASEAAKLIAVDSKVAQNA